MTKAPHHDENPNCDSAACVGQHRPQHPGSERGDERRTQGLDEEGLPREKDNANLSGHKAGHFRGDGHKKSHPSSAKLDREKPAGP